ncbi:(2Fe-2S)-binding protein [Mycobacterium sp. IS-1496]|nr:(2Fe-2S)-binding protein [Mycobacterium sp. IS-1496]
MPRRHVVAGAGLGTLAAALTACGGSGGGSGGEEPAEQTTGAPAGGEATGRALAKVADVPVGSGVIVEDLVVTQPTPGAFTGLSRVCTHKGCRVSEVVGAEIVCPCHGSRYHLDGSVANGPATSPLSAKPVAVQGEDIVLA